MQSSLLSKSSLTLQNKEEWLPSWSKKLNVIPYKSFKRSVFLQNINTNQDLGAAIFNEIEMIYKHDHDGQCPMVTFDNFNLDMTKDIIIPKNDSEWHEHFQHWQYNYNDRYMISNAPYHIDNNFNKPIKFEDWYNKMDSHKLWKNNKYLIKLQQLSNQLHDNITSLNNKHDLVLNCVISHEQIMDVYINNLEYLRRQQQFENNPECKRKYIYRSQAWTCYDNNKGHGMINKNKIPFDFEHLTQKFGLGPLLFNENNIGISIKCMQPGYLQCLDRTPLDLWSMHIQLSGTRILFSTSELNLDKTQGVQSFLSHENQCPMSAIHQQNIFPNLSHIGKLSVMVHNYMQLYVFQALLQLLKVEHLPLAYVCQIMKTGFNQFYLHQMIWTPLQNVNYIL